MKFFNLLISSGVVILAITSGPMAYAECPVLVGKYKCPGVLTVGAFDLEIKQTPQEGQMQYQAVMKGGHVGQAETLASTAGIKNSDGNLSKCVSHKLSIQGRDTALGEITGEIVKDKAGKLRITLIGVTPEPWEAMVCL